MELTNLEAKAIKAIYSDYHAGATNADETLHALEQLISNDELPKVKHDFYPEGDNEFIPDVKVVKVQGDYTERYVIFMWRGTEQWLKMSKDNEYHDNCWLVVETKYTDEFEEWLDKNLEGYDSLESMFSTGLDVAIPETYLVEFEQD